MFCPNCGLENGRANQFCRACGVDLRSVRGALEQTDGVTTSAVLARDEIGRAVAAKIREIDSAHELKKVVEDVLPEIEKFLESPAEKRLRRVRRGMVVTSVGLAATIAFTIVSTFGDEDLLVAAGAGFVVFFIGLSLIINGLLFTVTEKTLPGESTCAPRAELSAEQLMSEPVLLATDDVFSTVTEHTTHQLKEKQPVSGRG